MGRLVEPRPKRFELASEGGAPPQAKDTLRDFAERVAKYIPGEVLAFYVAAVNLTSAVPAAQKTKRVWLFGLVLAFFWLLTPVWLGRFSVDVKVRRMNQLMGLIAFGVWAYAYPSGWFSDRGLSDPIVSGVMLIIFTAISAFVVPKS